MELDLKSLQRSCGCGIEHHIYVKKCIIEAGAIRRLPDILKSMYPDKKHIVMICDENTYDVAGKIVEGLVPGIEKVILNPDNLHADERGVALAKNGLDRIGSADLMIAVGSGTVHDIVRYHAYQMQIPFLSVPTAASVDGFVSTVAAMTWNGCKVTFTAVSPEVVLADIDIYSKAPLRLTASGVSDLLGKYTALADWRIAHAVTGEVLCERICELEDEALADIKASLPGLPSGDIKAYEILMEGLLLSGLAMQMMGYSRPASGTEHHFSHLWEMAVINKPLDYYHGEKVGVGLVISSKIYHEAARRIREGNYQVKDQVDVEWDLLDKTFTRSDTHDTIVKENTPNIMGEIKGQDLVDNADEICNIIDGIPNPDELTALIDSVHGKKLLTDIGLDKSYQVRTARLSPYVRKRLTFMRLLKFYDFYEEVLAIK